MPTAHLKRIVFFGTPAFAAVHLEALLAHGEAAGWQVVGVVTAPDQRGVHANPRPCPVATVAHTHNLPLLQPPKLKDPEFLAALAAWQADLQVVVAFRMLPEVVWNMPPMGSLNVHGSLLPYYRGAAPINWALINGDTETGLTTFLLKHVIDTGDVLLRHKLDIRPEDDFGSLYDRMAEAGTSLLLETLAGLAKGTLIAEPQGDVPVLEAHKAHAPKVHAETGYLDLNTAPDVLVNWVRGLSPVPAATVSWGEAAPDGSPAPRMKLFRAQARTAVEVVAIAGKELAIGEVWYGSTRMLFGCRGGALEPLEVQLPGKKRLAVQQFLAGLRERVTVVG